MNGRDWSLRLMFFVWLIDRYVGKYLVRQASQHPDLLKEDLSIRSQSAMEEPRIFLVA